MARYHSIGNHLRRRKRCQFQPHDVGKDANESVSLILEISLIHSDILSECIVFKKLVENKI